MEKTRITYSPRAVHLQGPEVLHRCNPELYNSSANELLPIVAERWVNYFCAYAVAAVYYIAGNWKNAADWTRIQRRYRSEFKNLAGKADEWMSAEECERLEKIVAAF